MLTGETSHPTPAGAWMVHHLQHLLNDKLECALLQFSNTATSVCLFVHKPAVSHLVRICLFPGLLCQDGLTQTINAFSSFMCCFCAPLILLNLQLAHHLMTLTSILYYVLL